MMVRITDHSGQYRDYDDMDDVSLKIQSLIMNRIPFTVEYI